MASSTALRCPSCASIVFRVQPARLLNFLRVALSLAGGVLCALACTSTWVVDTMRNWPYFTVTRKTYTLFSVCWAAGPCVEEAGAGVRGGGVLLGVGGALGLADSLQGLARELMRWRLRRLPTWSSHLVASSRGAARARAMLAAVAFALATAGLAAAMGAPSTALPAATPSFGGFISALELGSVGRGLFYAVAGCVALAGAAAGALLAECGAPTVALPEAAGAAGGGGACAELRSFRAALAGDAHAAAEACGRWGGRWKAAVEGAGADKAGAAAQLPHVPPAHVEVATEYADF
jgi:hypothetical protein